MHLAFNAADAPALELAGLAEVPAEVVPQLRFDLHPSAASDPLAVSGVQRSGR